MELFLLRLAIYNEDGLPQGSKLSNLREIVVFCKLLKSEFEEEELVSYLEYSKACLAGMNGIQYSLNDYSDWSDFPNLHDILKTFIDLCPW